MKENVMDILKYLFESYLEEEFKHLPTDHQLQKELSLAGFNNSNITKAFQWLEELSQIENEIVEHQGQLNNRIFNSYELERFSTEARGFLLYLENKALLDFNLREVIIEKSLALDIEQIDLNLIQWVVLMVFYNISDSDAAFTWIEDIIFEDLSIIH